MTEPGGPVPLRPGALRALLRQPDLPPDLVAKISARADHLARVEQQRDAGNWASGWRALRPRMPIILAALVVTAGVAFMLSPVPPEEAPAALAPQDASTRPAVLTPPPLPMETDMETVAPATTPGKQPVANVAKAAPGRSPVGMEASPAPLAARGPSVSGRANVARARARVPSVGDVRPANVDKAPSPAPVTAPSGGNAAPLSGVISEPAPAMTVDLPATVPLIALPAQP